MKFVRPSTESKTKLNGGFSTRIISSVKAILMDDLPDDTLIRDFLPTGRFTLGSPLSTVRSRIRATSSHNLIWPGHTLMNLWILLSERVV